MSKIKRLREMCNIGTGRRSALLIITFGVLATMLGFGLSASGAVSRTGVAKTADITTDPPWHTAADI